MAKEHTNEPIFRIEISGMKKRFSNPKLYIPKKNGRPTIEPRKRWYVYFYWRTNKNGKLDRKFTFYKGLNELKTVQERKAVGKSLADGYKLALERGWNPEKKRTERTKTTTIKDALAFALEIKKDQLKEATIIDYEFRAGIFEKWLKDNCLLGVPANEMTVDHIYDFLDFLQIDYRQKNEKKLSNISIDNTKRAISALFTEMKNKRLIPQNFIKDIPKLKGKAEKNRPFTKTELESIKKELEKKDPYLIYFLYFMIYPILRPREIVRLKVGDINTKDWILGVETKNNLFSFSRIITKMQPIIKNMKIEGKPNEFNLFSPERKPAVWKTERLDSKVQYFSKRFTKVIRKMGYGEEYTLYSVRHTAIWHLYNGLQEKGMNERDIIAGLMQITGHGTESGLRNYLREIQIILPPDHSDIYTFDF